MRSLCPLRPLALVALVLALHLPGCSLMGLDDFDAMPCVSHADCANAASRLRPSSAACGAAVCQDGLCQWQEGKEICNGKDDDCDDLIDEKLVFSAPMSSSAPALPALVAYTSAPTAQTFAAVTVAEGPSRLLTLGPGPARSTSELQYASSSTSGPNECPTLLKGIASGAPGPCNFAEVALAADARHLVVASINTLGCASGQVRVGLSELDGEPFKVWLGKASDEQSEEPSNIAFGVYVDAEGHCTRSGATRPAVASLDTAAGGRGALLLWLAAPASALSVTPANAPLQPIAVMALGLIARKHEPEWLNGTEQGTPRELGRSTSLSAPAVLALNARSGRLAKYLVAFPAAQDSRLGVQLLTVYEQRDSLQVEPHDSLRDFLPVGAADQVSLALGNADEVGIAWRSGSGAEAQLHFMVIVMSDAGLAAGEIVRLPMPHPLFAPQILHQNTGFATVEPTGGWFLAWVEAESEQRQTLHVARVRDGAFEPLSQVALRSGIVAQPVLYPTSYDDVPSVGYALIQPSAAVQNDPETIDNWCH